MSRIDDILVDVRDILNDTPGDRWGNSVLLRLLTRGQNEVARTTQLLKGESPITLLQGVWTYSLPEDALEVKDILYAEEALEIRTTEWMDTHKGLDWRLTAVDDNTIEYIIFEQQDASKFRVYPRPFGGTFVEQYSFDPTPYGGSSTITGYTEESVYGEINDLLDAATISLPDGLYGIISEVTVSTALFVVYSRKPAALTATTDAMEVNAVYDDALVHYVAGMALRNDLAEQNRKFGAEELSLFAADMETLGAVASRDRISTADNTTSYNGMG